MIYALVIWTAVVSYAYPASGVTRDWKVLAELKPYNVSENTEAEMMKKCERAALELSLPKEKYRCIRLQ